MYGLEHYRGLSISSLADGRVCHPESPCWVESASYRLLSALVTGPAGKVLNGKWLPVGGCDYVVDVIIIRQYIAITPKAEVATVHTRSPIRIARIQCLASGLL